MFEVETRIDTTWYSVEEYRVMGYLAERLCGIYYMYLKQKEGIRSFELPKTLFHDTTPKLVLNPIFKEGVPIVLSANNKFAPYLDVMIQSIIANASPTRQYDIIVLFNDISEKIKIESNGGQGNTAISPFGLFGFVSILTMKNCL